MRVLDQVTLPGLSSWQILWGCKSSAHSLEVPGKPRVLVQTREGERGLWDHWWWGKKDRFLGSEISFTEELGARAECVIAQALHSRSSITILFRVEFMCCLLLTSIDVTCLKKKRLGKRSPVFLLFASKMHYLAKLFCYHLYLMGTLCWIEIIPTFSLVCFYSLKCRKG